MILLASRHAGEEVLVEAFVAQPLLKLSTKPFWWFAGSDVVPFHASFFLPGRDGA
jgi:hypothetical protein